MTAPENFNLSDEQRAAYLAKAAETRRVRAELKHRMKSGDVSVAEAMGDESAQRMPVRQFIASIPGIGKTHADAVIESMGIPEKRRVGGLGERQRESIVELAEVGYYKWAKDHVKKTAAAK